ncbi:lasso RiPP family leader peptide-containing protein [Salinibacter grassmerensis]|uniref:lasso RiPP family leader peptide-containing protein n=1 Tax=Salinibacter grassmerensis TaxID=3040353 RepID=UPI003C6E2EEC
MNEKKEYIKPSIVNYGSVEEVTRGGGASSSDGQGDNTAYSPGHPGYDANA